VGNFPPKITHFALKNHVLLITQDFCDVEGPFCETITLGGHFATKQNNTTRSTK